MYSDDDDVYYLFKKMRNLMNYMSTYHTSTSYQLINYSYVNNKIYNKKYGKNKQ